MDLNQITQLAYENMKDRKNPWFKERGSVYFHGLRTGKLAVNLRKRILPEDDSRDQVLYVSGLFHDIGKDIDPHNENGALITANILHDHCTEEEITLISDYIRKHNQRGKVTNRYIQILQDADSLDHEGTIHVWIHFIVTAFCNENIEDALTFWNEKIRNWDMNKDNLNYDVSREIFRERRTFFNAFMERLEKENQGKIIKL
jgi:uncharacterized protein